MKYKYCYKCGQQTQSIQTEGRIRQYCPDCEEILYKNPIPSVAVCATNPEGQLLLVKRNVKPQKGGWCLPGGFVESNETIRETALRELKEETGLNGSIKKLLGAYSHVEGHYGNVLLIGFVVSLSEYDLKAGDDASQARFFDWEELPEIVFRIHNKFINQYRDILDKEVGG